MLLANLVLVGTAATAAFAATPAKRDLTFPLDTIPSVCDTPCATYKDIFGTCPGSPGAAVCGGACNRTILTDLQVCINCTLINGPPNGMTQFNIDVLNGAQQQLAQECIDATFPATFTGKVPEPTTVPYPSGVDKATYVQNATATPAPVPTGSTQNSSSSANRTSSGATPSVSNITAPTGKLDAGAAAPHANVAGLLFAVAAGAALLL